MLVVSVCLFRFVCLVNRGAHELRPTRTVDVLVGGAVDGVDGAVAQLKPLLEQKRHRVDKGPRRESELERPRGSSRTQKKKGRLSIPSKAEDDADLSSHTPLPTPSRCSLSSYFCERILYGQTIKKSCCPWTL